MSGMPLVLANNNGVRVPYHVSRLKGHHMLLWSANAADSGA